MHDHDTSEKWGVRLSGLTILGMAIGLAGWWFGNEPVALSGYGLVYLAGGLPSAFRAKCSW